MPFHRRNRSRLVRHAIVFSVSGLTIGAISATVSPPNLFAQGSTWLDIVNAYRTSSGLPAITNDPTLQAGVDAHVKYLSATGSLQHGESSSHPLYSPAGDLAGKQSVLGGWTGSVRTDRELVDGWLVAPFHAIHFFEPRLQRAAFASLQGQTGTPLPSAAVMNIIGGIGPRVAIDKPVMFPGPNTVVPLTTFETEVPDPLTNCPGYQAPAGIGMIALFPKPVSGATASLKANGSPVESCLIDNSYQNPDPSGQATVRQILNQKNAVIVMAKNPMIPGTVYDIEINGSGQRAAWSFTAAAPGGPLPMKADSTPTSIASKVATPKVATSSQARTTKTTRKTTKKR